MWAEVEGASIIVKDGETEAAADLSEQRMIGVGSLPRLASGKGKDNVSTFLPKETGPQRPGGSEPAPLSVSAQNRGHCKGLPVSPFLRTSERSSSGPFIETFPEDRGRAPYSCECPTGSREYSTPRTSPAEIWVRGSTSLE